MTTRFLFAIVLLSNIAYSQTPSPQEMVRVQTSVYQHQKAFPANKDSLHICIRAYPLQYRNSLTQTVDFLREILVTPYEKAYGIFYFINQNVYYDLNSLEAANIPAERNNAIDVLQSGLAVCQGYSDLYRALADSLGLDCQLIGGTARPRQIGIGSHAWVEVYLENDTLLIDPTWASGQIKDGDTTEIFNTYYYDICPYLLRLTHHTTESPYFNRYCLPLDYFKSHQIDHEVTGIIMIYPAGNSLRVGMGREILVLTDTTIKQLWLYSSDLRQTPILFSTTGNGIWYTAIDVLGTMIRSRVSFYIGSTLWSIDPTEAKRIMSEPQFEARRWIRELHHYGLVQ